MKIISSFILTLFIASTLFGQNIIDKHFEAYKSMENYTNVSMSSKMFELAGYIEFDENDKELNELKEFITTIDALNLIVGREVENPKNKYASALSKVSNSHEELMRVDDNDDSFTFLINENRGVVKEFVMIGTTDQELFILSLTGKMNLRDLSKLAGKMQSHGLSQMQMFDDHRVEDVKVYPNPSAPGENITVEIPENMVGGTATLFNMNGGAVTTVDIENMTQNISTKGLAAGSYVVHLNKEGVTMKKRVIVQSK